MSIVSKPPAAGLECRELHSGDRMTREQFHEIYSRMPENFRAELIGGIVYVASPLRRPHGTMHPILSAVLCAYMGDTPGVEVGDNATVLLGKDGEPQPDLYLRILPDYGGQTRDTPNEYVSGPPEMVAEIAHGSHAIDLHAKRDEYARHGVREYLVISLQDRQVFCFDLTTNQEMNPGPNGIFRMKSFPGLWIDRDALLRKDYRSLMATLNQGLATPEHAEFVARLAAVRRAG